MGPDGAYRDHFVEAMEAAEIVTRICGALGEDRATSA
jgi:hypothetical protein